MVRLSLWTSLLLALLWAPAAAQAASAWSCSAGAGWIAAGGQRADAPGLGGAPCPNTSGDAAGATGPGSLAATGSLIVDGGAMSKTTDTRAPKADVQAKSLAIRNADGKLVLTASNLDVLAAGSCDANRVPSFTSSGSFGSVTLNGKSIDTSREYSEPGVGVNGAPLFGKITIRFSEIAKSDTGISRQAIHLIVSDRNGAILFEAVAGIVSAGRNGDVCVPPPVCPAGQEPRSGRCVDVSVTPLPDPASPGPAVPGPGVDPGLPRPGGSSPIRGGNSPRGCADTNARPGSISSTRLARSVLCLMNVQRAARHLKALRANGALGRIALRHARSMVAERYFSHDEPSGRSFLDRVLGSGYLGRFGKWRVGENLGFGTGRLGTPRALLTAWMRSTDHRRNILDRSFRDAGVAATSGSPRSKRGTTYVVDFGGFQIFH